MFFPMFEDPVRRLERVKREREHWQGIADKAEKIPWSEDFKITKAPCVFAAHTWQPMRLFDVECGPTLEAPHEDKGVISPNRLWIYDESMIPAAVPMPMINGSVRTHWLFDAAAPITRLWEFKSDYRWVLWMSYTPFEIASQRPGLRIAKGHVIVAGMGMGWLLARVLQKKNVTKVTLVEHSQPLCDWLLPQIRARHLHGCEHKLQVVIGDAQDVIPELQADVALWDIWEGIGNVDAYDERKMAAKCPGIKRTWFWGAHIRREHEERGLWW